MQKLLRTDLRKSRPKRKHSGQNGPTVIKGVHLKTKETKDLQKDENWYRALYVDWMSDPRHNADVRSAARFIHKTGCPVEYVKRWRLDLEVQKEIRGVVRERFGGGERIKELYNALWQRGISGNVAAIKLALELTGEYTPKMEVKSKTLEDYLSQMEESDREKFNALREKHAPKDESDGRILH